MSLLFWTNFSLLNRYLLLKQTLLLQSSQIPLFFWSKRFSFRQRSCLQWVSSFERTSIFSMALSDEGLVFNESLLLNELQSSQWLSSSEANAFHSDEGLVFDESLLLNFSLLNRSLLLKQTLLTSTKVLSSMSLFFWTNFSPLNRYLLLKQTHVIPTKVLSSMSLFFWANFSLRKATLLVIQAHVPSTAHMPQVSKTYVLEEGCRTLLLGQRNAPRQGVSRGMGFREGRLWLRCSYAVPTRREVSQGSRKGLAKEGVSPRL